MHSINNVERPWSFGRPPCLRGKVLGMRIQAPKELPGKCPKSYDKRENVGHRRSFIVVGVLPGRVSVCLPKGIDQYPRENGTPFPANIEAVREWRPGIGESPNEFKLYGLARTLSNTRCYKSDRSQLPVWCLGKPADCRIGMTKVED